MESHVVDSSNTALVIPLYLESFIHIYEIFILVFFLIPRFFFSPLIIYLLLYFSYSSHQHDPKTNKKKTNIMFYVSINLTILPPNPIVFHNFPLNQTLHFLFTFNSSSFSSSIFHHNLYLTKTISHFHSSNKNKPTLFVFYLTLKYSDPFSLI